MQRKQDKKTQTSKAQLSHTASCSFSTHLLFWSSHAIICCFSLPCVIFFCGTGHSHAHKYTYMTSLLAHSLLVSPCTCHAFTQFALPSSYINIESARSLTLSLLPHPFTCYCFAPAAPMFGFNLIQHQLSPSALATETYSLLLTNSPTTNGWFHSWCPSWKDLNWIVLCVIVTLTKHEWRYYARCTGDSSD